VVDFKLREKSRTITSRGCHNTIYGMWLNSFINSFDFQIPSNWDGRVFKDKIRISRWFEGLW
jgi:hypothetical protein